MKADPVLLFAVTIRIYGSHPYSSHVFAHFGFHVRNNDTGSIIVPHVAFISGRYRLSLIHINPFVRTTFDEKGFC
jgi:hypothetical protein